MAAKGSTEEPDQKAWTHIRSTLSVVLTVMAVAVVCWLGFQLRLVLLLGLTSVMFSYVLAPLVLFVEKRKIARERAVLVVYGGITGIVAVVALALVPRGVGQLRQLVTEGPAYIDALRARLDTTSQYGPTPALQDAITHGRELGLKALETNLGNAVISVLGTLRVVPWLLLIPVVAFFFLRESSRILSSFLSALPTGRTRWRGAELIEDLNEQLAFFVRAQLLACVSVGVLCAIGLSVIGLKYALLLALLAAICEFVPVIGPLGVGGLAILLASFEDPSRAGVTVAFWVVLRLVQSQLIYPALISHSTKLHPLAIIIALICGSQLGGIPGLFLAIPMTVAGVVLFRYLKRQLGAEGVVAALLRTEEPPDVPALTQAPARYSAQKRLTLLSIVVVDNEADAREMLADTLEAEGATVWAAGSADEAINLVKTHLPDLVISDIGMPGTDGFDFMHHLRQLKPAEGGKTLAAALTGYTTEEDHARSKTAGFQLHMHKPIDRDTLVSNIVGLVRVRAAG